MASHPRIMSEKPHADIQPQVDRAVYFGRGYLNPGRFASYGYQLQEIMSLQPRNVLEIGIGNGVVSYVLRQAGIEVTTLDFDLSLQPDIVASVTHMPSADDSYDVVACFEVLEHLPWRLATAALSEIHRVCARHALISLPDARPALRFRVPRIGARQFLVELPLWTMRDHRFDGEHYWEINRNGYPLRRIVASMNRAGFSVEKTWRLWEYPRHRFFRLRVAER